MFTNNKRSKFNHVFNIISLYQYIRLNDIFCFLINSILKLIGPILLFQHYLSGIAGRPCVLMYKARPCHERPFSRNLVFICELSGVCHAQNLSNQQFQKTVSFFFALINTKLHHAFLLFLIQKNPQKTLLHEYTMIELLVFQIVIQIGTIFHNIKRKSLLFDHRWYIVQNFNILFIMMHIKKVVAPFYLYIFFQ